MPKGKAWKYSVGPYGARVRVQERQPGGPIYVFVWDADTGRCVKRSLRFRVRAPDGAFIPEAVEAAKKKAARLSNRLISSRSYEISAPRLGEVARLFISERSQHLKGQYKVETERDVELWLRYLGSSFDLSQFGEREWQAFIRQRRAGEIDAHGRSVSDHGKRREVGNRTIQKSLKVLRLMCRFASGYRRRNGSFLLDFDPTRGLRLPTESDPRRPGCDDYMYQALLTAAEEVRMRVKGSRVRSHLPDLIVLAGYTGRRIGSILDLRYSDWLPAKGRCGSIKWRADSDKVNRSWETPVSEEVRDTLNRIQARRPGIGDAFLFPAPNSVGAVRVDVARRWLRRAEEIAGIDHNLGFGWHSFRRMWASKRKHYPVQDVAAAGGWIDTQTLQRVYQQPDPATIERVVFNDRAIG